MQYKKIAFIKAGSFSNTNDSLLQILQKQFHDYTIDIIDVYSLLKKRQLILAINILFALRDYGWKMLKSRNKNVMIWYFFSTRYLFHKINTLVAQCLAAENYAFIFQSQAFFDASQQEIPHFLYTDNTELANLYYEDFDMSKILPPSRIELERRVYQSATKNLLMSSNIVKSMIDQYGCKQEQVACVYAGSNVKFNNSNCPAINYHNQNILFVGVDWERKGGSTLVEAFKRVLQSYPNAKLTVVGCSPDLNVPNCHVVGRVPLEEVGRYYEQASIFCLPTTFEPFGIVFIEALMYKLPIVATNIAAIPDFITDHENGYLVKPHDVEQLANALMSLLANPSKCQAFGEKGYALAMERYSWENVGLRIKEIIEPIISK